MVRLSFSGFVYDMLRDICIGRARDSVQASEAKGTGREREIKQKINPTKKKSPNLY